MTVHSPMLRSMVDDGIELFPNASSDASRKTLIVLASPYLFARYLKRRKSYTEIPTEAPADASAQVAAPRDTLDYTEMFITAYCNLKCKYCSASIPYYKNKYHIGIDFLIRQMDAYLEAINGVDRFRIIGGEPFLHPQLDVIIEHLLASPKIGRIHIVTNGAIVPKAPHLMELLKDDRVVLDISNYGPVSDKVPELQEMEQAGLLHLIVNEVNEWFEPNHVYDDMGLTPEQIAKRYHACPDFCHVLRDGKFFTCGEAFHIANIPNSPMKAGIDYVDIFDDSMPIEEKRQLILDIAYKRTPSCAACNHCGGGSFLYKDRKLIPGEQPKDGEVFEFDLPIDIPVVSGKMI